MVFGSVIYVTPEKHRAVPQASRVAINGVQQGFHCFFTFEQTFIHTNNSESEYRFVYPSEAKFCIYSVTFYIDDEVIVLQIHEREESNVIYNETVAKNGKSLLLTESLPKGYNESVIGVVKSEQVVKCVIKCCCSSQTVNYNTISTTFPLEIANPQGKAQPLPKFEFKLKVLMNEEIENVFNVSSNETDHFIKSGFVKSSPFSGVFCYKKNVFSEEELENASKNNSTTPTKMVKKVAINDTKFVVYTVMKNNLSSFGLRSKDTIALTLIPPFQYNEIGGNNNNIINNNNKSLNKVSEEYIFMIDCSGSMSGSPINRAKEALEIFIRSLPLNCTFNIIRFGSTFEFLFESPKEYSDEDSVKKALKLSRTLKADLGGTDLLDPLQFIVKRERGNRSIFIVTDGDDVDNNEIILKLVKDNVDNRVFSIGMGREADPVLVEGLASVSGGMSDFVFSNDNLAEKIVNMLAFAMSARLSEVCVEADSVPKESMEISPRPLPQLVPQVAKTIYLRLPEGAPKINSIRVSGIYMNENVSFTVDKIDLLRAENFQNNNIINNINISNYINNNNFNNSNDINADNNDICCYDGCELSIFPLFADNEIRSIESEIHSSKNKSIDSAKQKCIDLSLKSGVPSEFTSYIGLHSSTSVTQASNRTKRHSSFTIGLEESNPKNTSKSMLSDFSKRTNNYNDDDDEFHNSSDKIDIGTSLIDDTPLSPSAQQQTSMNSFSNDSTTNKTKKKKGFSSFFSSLFHSKNGNINNNNNNNISNINYESSSSAIDNSSIMSEKERENRKNMELDDDFVIQPKPAKIGQFDFFNLLTTFDHRGFFFDPVLVLKMSGGLILRSEDDKSVVLCSIKDDNDREMNTKMKQMLKSLDESSRAIGGGCDLCANPFIIATVLAVGLIRKKKSDERGIWFLIEGKAAKWMMSQGVKIPENCFSEAQRLFA